MDRNRLRHWQHRHQSSEAVGTPSPFVERALNVLAESAPLITTRRALDLACGQGRHSLLLADHGYDVDAIDFALPALIKLKQAADARGLRIRCLATDVTTWSLPPARYAIVVVVNFLERSLFAPLRAAVAPGGVILYQTHRRDEQITSPTVGSDFLLAPGELDEVFSDWRVLARHDNTAIHDGKLIARSGILAQRPLEASPIARGH